MELHDMMRRWADQENHERDYYPKCGNDNGGKWNNDHCSGNKSLRDYSRSSRKRKPHDVVVAIDRIPCGKKSRNHQEQFEKVLHKQS
jgi:hypothetical protein